MTESMLSADNSPTKPLICLDDFLKASGIADTGGQAKMIIQSGRVKLNGQVETRRRKKLAFGDLVEVDATTSLRVGES